MSHTQGWIVAGLAAVALTAACSSSGGGQHTTNAAGTTVAVRTVSGTGRVLVDAAGRTLYTSDQERAAGAVLCATPDCTAIWLPLTIKAGERPSAPSGVAAALSTVRRPDGSRQVALDGVPLYTFSFDHGPGEVNGEGQRDSFGGRNFTWHAAVASGAVRAPAPATTPDYGTGGY
jgi:predicted lipoprotein with Yx(FWY)xxD motif